MNTKESDKDGNKMCETTFTNNKIKLILFPFFILFYSIYGINLNLEKNITIY